MKRRDRIKMAEWLARKHGGDPKQIYAELLAQDEQAEYSKRPWITWSGSVKAKWQRVRV